MWQGCFSALVTPFDDDFQVDFPSLKNLLQHQIDNHIDGLVILGSTAEAATLNDEEKLAIIDFVIQNTPAQLALVVGISDIATARVTEFIAKIQHITRINAYLCTPSAYVRPTPNGMLAHFNQIANFSSKPILLYNVPSRTACDLNNQVVLALAQQQQFIGLKDATGDLARFNLLLQDKPQNFMLFSGDDYSAVSYILSGGDGVISVASNVLPQAFVRLCQLALAGNKPQAIALNQAMQKFYYQLYTESNPIPVKYALYHLGIIKTPQLRLPLEKLSATNIANLTQELDKTLINLNFLVNAK